MESIFKVARPLSLNGYDILNKNLFLMNSEDLARQQIADSEELNTNLSLSIALDPVIELPAENEGECYGGAEIPAVLQAGKLW